MQYYLLDTNVFNAAVTGASGAVIERLNASISAHRDIQQPDTAFCMTPFSVLEALGTTWSDIDVLPKTDRALTAAQIVADIVTRAKAAFSALPELQQPGLLERALERRSFLPAECHALFDLGVTNLCKRLEITEELAATLAWDHALKATFPKARKQEFDTFLMTIIVAAKAGPTISRFRIVKRLWDRFYQTRSMHGGDAEGIAKTNRSMRLKTTRDFLDCDLLHLVCFGWFGNEVVAFTCDPEEVIIDRIRAYKGIVAIAREWAKDLDPAELPTYKDGHIAFCEPNGEIRRLVRASDIAAIV